jgi:hypothetical protein
LFNGYEPFSNALYTATSAADVAVVAQSGGRQLSTGYNNSKAVNADGQVVFTDFGIEPGSRGIFTARAGGPVVPIALETMPVQAGSFMRFLEFLGSEFQINDQGVVAFTALTGSPVGPSRGSSLFVYRQDFGLLPVALTGDFVDMPSGVAKQISQVGSFSLNDDGVLAFGARMDDGTTAIFQLTVPEPSVVGLATLASALLLRRPRQMLRKGQKP